MKQLLPLILLLALASCSSLKNTGRTRHTTEARKATVTVTTGESTTSTRCILQAVHDSVCVWSIRPLLNIEAGQLRAGKDGITIIDRIHRLYARAGYKELPTMLRTLLKYKTIEKYTTGKKLKSGNGNSLTRTFRHKGAKTSVTIDYGQIEHDNNMRLMEDRTDRYKETSLQSLLEKTGIKL